MSPGRKFRPGDGFKGRDAVRLPLRKNMEGDLPLHRVSVYEPPFS